MKKYFLLISLLAFLSSQLYASKSTSVKTSPAKNTAAKAKVKRYSISQAELKKKAVTVGFTQKYADPKMQNLELPGLINKYGADDVCGKIIRVLRYQNITRAVEQKYNLPRNLLLAMIMEESTGVDMLPNAHDDGGIGLIHMQPALASDFGLATYGDCEKMRCKQHGKKLRDIIEDNNYDRKKIIRYDDRFHPVKNIDAAGRMIAYYMQGPTISDLGPMRCAIKRYAGKWNYKKYWNHVVKNMAYLNSKEVALEVEKRFNALNQKLLINKRPANFKEYIRVSQLQNFNYDLAKYKGTRKYQIMNSDGGVAMYRNYVVPCERKLGNNPCDS